jgi:flagellar basal body-associated protein FliL
MLYFYKWTKFNCSVAIVITIIIIVIVVVAAAAVAVQPRVHKFSKNLEATSKFQASER